MSPGPSRLKVEGGDLSFSQMADRVTGCCPLPRPREPANVQRVSNGAAAADRCAENGTNVPLCDGDGGDRGGLR